MFLNQALDYKNPFWMYLLGSFVIIIFVIIGQLPITFFITKESISAAGGDPMTALRSLDKNLQLILLLIPFLVGFLGLFLVVKKIHNRSLISISTSRESLDWNRIIYAFSIWSLVSILLITGDYFLNPDSYEWNFNFKSFSLLLIISVLLMPIQTSLEEYIFRGYLMQGFYSFFNSRWGTLLITSIVFGSLHFSNPEVQKLGLGVMAYYIGTGLFLGILTLMDEGIELALGFHASNNIMTALFVTSSWTVFQTESILIDISEPTLGVETFFSLFILYPGFIFLMSRKFDWSGWKNKLISKL
jgi:membrane protease YdiL (CAAX protease family)